jgi:hypothetical protein
MARSNAAESRPPVKELPSAPAGDYDDVSELLGVVVDHERRRGRGAQSNASGRYEPTARVAFDDGWRTLDELPPFKTTVTVDSTRKIIPATTRLTSASTDRSIPTGVASTVASTALRGRRTRTLVSRPVLISNPSCW